MKPELIGPPSDSAFVRRLLLGLLILGVAILAWSLLDLVLLAFGAVLIAVLLDALATALRRFARLPQPLALPAAVLALAAIITVATWLFGSEVAAQARTLIDQVPEAWRTLEQRLGDTALGERLLSWVASASPDGSGVISGVRRVIVSLGNAALGIVLVLAGGIYLAAQPELYLVGTLKLVPRERRALARETLEAVGRALRLWLLGQLVSMVLIGVLTGIGLAIIGVPSALALGVLAGIAEFVPLVGPVLAAVPALLLALAQGPEMALWTLALYVLLQQVEGNVVQPLVQQRAVALPPALTLFAIVAAGVVFGALGVLLAAPLTVVSYVAVKKLYVQEALDTATPIPGEQHEQR